METLQTFINNKFKTLSLTTALVSFSLFLLMIRVKLNQTFFLIFLVWNVFLALIPYAITMYLDTSRGNKLKLLCWFAIWLLFLPNAPYLITDLKHLRLASGHLFWLDVLVLFSFAITGLTLFFITMIAMGRLLAKTFTRLPKKLFECTMCVLTAFGIYLGRILRYNSWEILSNPFQLLTDCFAIILNPMQYKEAWLFTICFGCFLYLGYWMFKSFTLAHLHNPEDN